MYDKIEIWWDHNTFGYRQNGVALYIRYIGKNMPVGLATIVPGDDNPISGGGTPVAYSNVTIPYGKNLFFETIPFEMLRTYETEPQVLVTVGEHPAVCHNLSCNFTYTVPVGEVSSYDFDNSTKTLVINGTELPANISDIRFVKFALSKCSVSNITEFNTTTSNSTVTNITTGCTNTTNNATATAPCNTTTTTNTTVTH